MIESMGSLKTIDGKILMSCLTDYKSEFNTHQKSNRATKIYMLQRSNDDFQKFSQAAAYQYKIVKRLMGCKDLQFIINEIDFDFYIGMGNYFYKTIPELILGNLLFSNEIKFDFLEFYEGEVGFTPTKTSTFVLQDVGITLHINADASGKNDQIFVEVNYQEENPFNPSKMYLYDCREFRTFSLQNYMRNLASNFIEHDVHINPKTVDLLYLIPDFSGQALLTESLLRETDNSDDRFEVY
jgi:hypothetical protein